MKAFLGLTDNYGTMLWKIAFSTMSFTVLALWILTQIDDGISNLIGRFSVSVPVISGFSLSMGYLVPTMIIGFISRGLRMHNQISNVLRIRRNFDVDHILTPLAVGVGLGAVPQLRNRLAADRTRLMNVCFYRYAGSFNPQIDQHLIRMALDAWTWYWIVLESTAIAVGFLIVTLVRGHFTTGLWTVGVIALQLLLLKLQMPSCRERALQEVQAIMDIPGANEQIRNELSALQSRGA